MSARSEEEVVLEHALRDVEHLHIALMIIDVRDKLYGQVIASFLEALKKELAPRLGQQWKLTSLRDPEQIAQQYAYCFEARFQKHPANFRVVLSADRQGYPKRPYLAIHYDKEHAIQSVDLETIKRMVDQEYIVGKSDYSLWYQFVDQFGKGYSPWGEKDVLVRLYRKDESVRFFAEHLEQVARALAKTLGSIVAS